MITLCTASFYPKICTASFYPKICTASFVPAAFYNVSIVKRQGPKYNPLMDADRYIGHIAN